MPATDRLRLRKIRGYTSESVTLARPTMGEVIAILVARSPERPSPNDYGIGLLVHRPSVVQFAAAPASLGKNSARGRNVPFAGSFLISFGGTSDQGAAARPAAVWVLLERNPPQPSPGPGRHPRLGI